MEHTSAETGLVSAPMVPDTEKTAGEVLVELDAAIAELDLPELAETMEEADARAAASTFLFVMRNVKRDLDANDAEFTVLQDFNRRRHVARQKGLIAQIEYLGGAIRKLFGFMTVTGKKKSLNLVGGRVGMRGKPDELVVEDDEAVIEWADAHGVPGIIVRKPRLDRKELRAYLENIAADADHDPDGRGPPPPPPGAKLEQRDDVFYATPAQD